MVRYNNYKSYKYSPVAEAQRAKREQRFRADISHHATLLSHNPSTVTDEDESSSKRARTASEADVGVAMEAAIPSGDEADPGPRVLPESQGACPFDEYGDIATLLGEHPEPGHATPAVQALLKQAEVDLVAIRSFIV